MTPPSPEPPIDEPEPYPCECGHETYDHDRLGACIECPCMDYQPDAGPYDDGDAAYDLIRERELFDD